MAATSASTSPEQNIGPVARSGLEELFNLSQIISDSVKKIGAELSGAGLDFPSLHGQFTPQSEAARLLPEVRDATIIIAAAAAQLTATVYPPPMTVLKTAMSFNVSAALNVAAEAHVAEALRAVGSHGLSVVDIAKVSGIDPAKLSRVLRLLVTHSIFQEVHPDVFAHNRLSWFLDTGKSLESILNNPKGKHDNTTGIAAAIGHEADEAMKAVSYLTEAILDPVSGHANDIHDLGFNRALSTPKTMWEFYDIPSQDFRLRRFGTAMEGTKNMAPPLAIFEGGDWSTLGEKALVVDVGGGIGAQSLTLSRSCPTLKFIVQDREPLMEPAKKFWMAENSEALLSGRVVLQVHDFFQPQTVTNADVFLIRMILHDYPDQDCLTILRHLRAAARPSTQLVVVDNIMAYACDEPAANEVPGATISPPPAPLLPNFGEANSVAYLMDVQMMGLTGGVERTLTQVRDLLAEAGWKVTRVHHGSPFVLSHQKIFAVPM
ncbi:S-adenosyl-L-methionine-dependent methyltransferase [Peniophora sp. CONT]|nr:S-adenosyl-L-methionine-dependent methyltransferase [Peniophora sp. CONT]